MSNSAAWPGGLGSQPLARLRIASTCLVKLEPCCPQRNSRVWRTLRSAIARAAREAARPSDSFVSASLGPRACAPARRRSRLAAHTLEGHRLGAGLGHAGPPAFRGVPALKYVAGAGGRKLLASRQRGRKPAAVFVCGGDRRKDRPP